MFLFVLPSALPDVFSLGCSGEGPGSAVCVPAGAEGASVGSARDVRARVQRRHRRPGQQEPAVRLQPPTSVHHHGEKGHVHTERIDRSSSLNPFLAASVRRTPRCRRLTAAPVPHPSGRHLNERVVLFDHLLIQWTSATHPSALPHTSAIDSLPAAPLVLHSPLFPPSISPSICPFISRSPSLSPRRGETGVID